MLGPEVTSCSLP